MPKEIICAECGEKGEEETSYRYSITDGWGHTEGENDTPSRPLCKIHFSEYKIKKEQERNEKIQIEFEKDLEGRKRAPVKLQQTYNLSPGYTNSLLSRAQPWAHESIEKMLTDINRVRRLMTISDEEKTIEIVDISVFTHETKVTFKTRYPAYNPWFLVAREIYKLKNKKSTSEPEPIHGFIDDKYKDYLLSEEWQKKRDTVLERDNYACRICNCGDELHVHHKTYENIYEEPLGDLITLCKACHEHFHGKGE